ncbi:MAG: hypothetical protein H7332_09140 [Bdellovibrionales bacterium]|nr:hypothetical protein [Ramlibacter sp.]
MTPFFLDGKMLTMQGVFYPTGYIMAMLPDRDSANAVGREMAAHPGGGQVSLVEPAEVISIIGGTVKGTDDGSGMPSAGSEAATVREFVELAQKGHCGMLIEVPDDANLQRAKDVLHAHNFSYAQRYRMLVIEDIT